jgi:hypothetical protein
VGRVRRGSSDSIPSGRITLPGRPGAPGRRDIFNGSGDLDALSDVFTECSA